MAEPAPIACVADESPHAAFGWAIETNGRTPEISSIPAPALTVANRTEPRTTTESYERRRTGNRLFWLGMPCGHRPLPRSGRLGALPAAGCEPGPGRTGDGRGSRPGRPQGGADRQAAAPLVGPARPARQRAA